MLPAVKILMNYKKSWLTQLCKEAGLSTKGTRLDLARRRAKYNEEGFARAWRIISGGRR